MRSPYVPLLSILLLALAHTASTTAPLTPGRVVQIQPVALDVMLSIYDRAVVLFTSGVKPENTHKFQHAIKAIIEGSDADKFNKTIFAICDIDKDHSGKLSKFGSKESIQIITGISHYTLLYPSTPGKIDNYFNAEFPQFLANHTASKVRSLSRKDLTTSPHKDGFLVFISTTNETTLNKTHAVYHNIFDFLNFFNTSFAVNAHYETENKIELLRNGQLFTRYASSAVQALLGYKDEPLREEINDLVDFVNVETIDSVTLLDNDNYFRVFGSSIQLQMLLVYRQKDKESEDIKKILKQYEIAATRNRNQGLKYERVLFAAATKQFLSEYFADQILTDPQKLYEILITKTDYSSFQLRKYIYEPKQVTADTLVNFIQEVRMKKIDPQYKSQEVEDNEGRKIRKIVGNNFISEVFEQAERSVMVLFIDSKDSNFTIPYRTALEAFVEKYQGAYKKYMNVGVFDLAKNEHKALTISTAPELIMFERSNKKKAKFFKGTPTEENIKNWVNYEAKDFTIPENYGEPPVALGPSGGEL